MPVHILIADDEESIRFTFASILEEAGYRVTTTGSLSQCIKKMQAQRYDLLFLDINMGDDNGIEAIQGLRTIQPNCAVVIITGGMSSKTIVKARGYGAADYLVKPIRQASLLYIVQTTLNRKVAANQ